MRNPSDQRAFSLVELMVSMTILALLLILLGSATTEVQRGWERTEARVSQFREARAAFEIVTRNLTQATLNSYWDYDNTEDPTEYLRQSELHFVSGPAADLLSGSPAAAGLEARPLHSVFFQAPLGFSTDSIYRQLGTMLNSRGYFIEFGGDLAGVPAFVQNNTPGGYEERMRFRLMQFMPPSEKNLVYAHDPNPATAPPGNPPRDTWFNNPELIDTYARPVADNIVALILSPRKAESEGVDEDPFGIAPQYRWDSSLAANPGAPATSRSTKNVLPPLMQVTLVAIDERSAARLELTEGTSDDILTKVFTNCPFTDASEYETDLEALKSNLTELGLNYRVFSTTITLRASKYGSD